MLRYGTVFTLLLGITVTLACGPAPKEGVVEKTADVSTASAPVPSPTPAPSPTPTISTALLRLVKGDPKDLIVQLEDLPSGFQMVTGEYEGPNDYTVAYFRPEALISENPSETNLLGVIVNLGIYDDAMAAREQFKAQGSLDRDSIASSIAEASGDATPIDVQPYAVQLRGTGEVIAFRVQYAIGSTSVIDYRYRFVVGNALANVIVTARTVGTGEDSATFREQARAIVEQQIAHLTEARR